MKRPKTISFKVNKLSMSVIYEYECGKVWVNCINGGQDKMWIDNGLMWMTWTSMKDIDNDPYDPYTCMSALL